MRRSAVGWWAAGLAVAVWGGLRIGNVFGQTDAPTYVGLAAGRPVMLPFAWRQLGPLMVRGLAAGLHTSIERGFLIEGGLALAVFLGITLALVGRSGAPRWMLPAVAGMFFWAGQFNGLALPDLTFAALLAVFLWLLEADLVVLAGLMLFPLSVARESTLLVLVCLLAVGWRRLRTGAVVVALGATAAGLLTVRLLTRDALPNREHLPGLIYLVAKVPGNLLRNVLGIEPWANVYASCAVPVGQMPVHLGSLQAVGVCGWGWEYPLRTLALALASFGLLPLLLVQARRVGLGDSLLLRFCVVYGAVSFVAAPALGFLVWRLFDYGWPLFLVALPLLLGASGARFTSGWAAAVFVGLHLLLSWSVWWVFFLGRVPLLGVEAVLYVVGWWWLRKTFWVEDRGVSGGEDSHDNPALRFGRSRGTRM